MDAAISLLCPILTIGRGFDAQINGAMVGVPEFRRFFGTLYEGQPIVPASWLAAFGSISSVGQFFGGFLCSWLSDRIGRRFSLLIGLLFVTGGIFGEVFSHTRVAFLLGKLVLGFGLGFYLTIGPLYASEIAPVALRGIVTGGTNLSICIGQLLANGVIAGFGDRTDLWSFRGPFAVQWIFAAIMYIGLPFAPESPWYYVRKGNNEKAEKCLKQLYGKNTDVKSKLAMIRAIVERDIEVAQSTKWIQCFQGTNLLRTIISVAVFACQQLSGIIFVLGYSSYFFQLAGINTKHSFDLGVGITACGVVGCAIAWSLMNTWGRRNLFITGMAGMTVVLMLMGILDVVHTSAARWVEASCTVVYALIYQATIGPLAFAILGETSTPALRAKTIGLATACQAVFGTVFNIVIGYLINPDEANLKVSFCFLDHVNISNLKQGKVGFIFGGFCAIGTLWSYFYVPELKGRTFAEIDIIFTNKVKARHTKNYVVPSTGV